MTDVIYKRGDTAPPLRAFLVDPEGVAKDLSGSTVVLVIRPRRGTTFVELPCTLVNAAGGVVERDWQTGDLDTEGWYYICWEVEYGSGKIETFPGEGYDRLRVISDLNPPP